MGVVRVVFHSVVLSCLALGCGDSSGGGGAAPTSSGVAASVALSALTDSQTQMLCKFAERSYKASLPSTKDAYCGSQGILGAASSQECMELKQECITDGDFEDDINEDWECETETAADVVDDDSGPCTATVADLEACVRADSQERKQRASTASCDNAASWESADAAECVSLQTKCPGFDL